MPSLHWVTGDGPIVLLLVAAAVLYSVFHYFLSVERWSERLRARGRPEEEVQGAAVLLRRVSGGLVLGLGMAVALLAAGESPLAHGIASFAWKETALSLVPALILLPLVARAAKGEEVRRLQPEIRARRISRRLARRSALAWGVYLCGYEYLFRGALLWFLAGALGVWPALAITTALYVVVHLPKPSPGETFGSVLMGFVFGLASLYSGSFVAAWLLHWAVALTAERVAGKAELGADWRHPD